MSRRSIEKHILMTKVEAQDLRKKAKKACLSEAALIRLLVKGYEPREKPDDRFYDVMKELSAIGNNLNQLTKLSNMGQIKTVDLYETRAAMDALYGEIFRIARTKDGDN